MLHLFKYRSSYSIIFQKLDKQYDGRTGRASQQFFFPVFLDMVVRERARTEKWNCTRLKPIGREDKPSGSERGYMHSVAVGK